MYTIDKKTDPEYYIIYKDNKEHVKIAKCCNDLYIILAYYGIKKEDLDD